MNLSDPDGCSLHNWISPYFGAECPDCEKLVKCDVTCGALLEPITLEEHKKALEHWRKHHYLSGCSHGR